MSDATARGLHAALERLRAGQALTLEEADAAFEEIASGAGHAAVVGAMLALLASRTPSEEELAAAAGVMRRHVVRVPTRIPPAEILDTAGTGGAPKRFNASTAAAIVAAACGARVAKHGNRSRTGRGSSEVLAALGVNVDASPEVQARSLEEVGICFSFSQRHHPTARHVAEVRAALPFPTLFNLVGPLVNPAGALRQVMGVHHESLLEPVAGALRRLGCVRGMVIHSEDGLDELSVDAPTHVMELAGGVVRRTHVDPRHLGLEAGMRPEDAPRTLAEAAALLRRVIRGDERGAARRMTLLNAAAALVVAERAPDLASGVAAAAGAIDFGDAWSVLERMVVASGGRMTEER